MARAVADAVAGGGAVLLFGNGGSAADAQHLAGELLGRLRLERRPVGAVALADGVAATTAIANDYDFAAVFARQVEGLGRPGDVAIALSTSGESENVVRGVEAANRIGLVTIALTGRSGGRLLGLARHCVCVPAEDTQRIQQLHMLIGHVLCELVEREVAAAAGSG